MTRAELDEKLQRDFKRDGFVALNRFVDGQSLNDLVAHVDEFVREFVPGLPDDQVFCERKGDLATLKQIQHMEVHDPWFHRLFTKDCFRSLAELLLDGPVAPRNMQYFNKPPGFSQATPAHQDGYYFMLDPCEAVTMWLALEETDEENGCVRYVPGSHRNGLREHARTQTLGFSQGIVDYPTEQDRATEIAVPARPG